MTPLHGLRAAGPFMTGAGTGAKVGLGGGDAPKRVVTSRTKPQPSPCPTPPRASKCTTPPRAKLGVDPTTQAVAVSITVKTRFMITTPPSEPAGLVLCSHLDAGMVALTIVDKHAGACPVSHRAFASIWRSPGAGVR